MNTFKALALFFMVYPVWAIPMMAYQIEDTGTLMWGILYALGVGAAGIVLKSMEGGRAPTNTHRNQMDKGIKDGR